MGDRVMLDEVSICCCFDWEVLGFIERDFRWTKTLTFVNQRNLWIPTTSKCHLHRDCQNATDSV